MDRREPAIFAEWERSDDPVKRAHVANVRAMRAERTARGPGPAEFPPLAEQVTHAISDAITFVRSGGARVSDEEKARRLAICAACPHLRDDRCVKCGCSMPYRARAAAFHCPIKLW